MTNCSVPWRSSGGRGEFEYVPSYSLTGRDINIDFEGLGIVMPAEVRGVFGEKQKKPRLRKFERYNRKKLHLPQLIMAVARLPIPAREFKGKLPSFPLENKSFLMDKMDFEIIDDDDATVTLRPLRVSIWKSEVEFDLTDRFEIVKNDFELIDTLAEEHPNLSNALRDHRDCINLGVNSSNILKAADRVIREQQIAFGPTNAGSTTKVYQTVKLQETDLEEDISANEGKILVRMHAYRERNAGLSKKAKALFKQKNEGRLFCEICFLEPVLKYGKPGDRAIEAHHKVPISELQPDSTTRPDDLAMVCASCHRIIHSSMPCLVPSQVLASTETV